MASTTCQSRTGVVINVSNVPDNFSSANRRIVITGAARSRISQKYGVPKNNSVTGIGVDSRRSLTSSTTKLNPIRNAAAAMIT